MEEDKTYCYSYFGIGSNYSFEIKDGSEAYGHEGVPAPNSDFDPDDITQRMGMEPYRARRMGEARPGYPHHPKSRFSSWSACYQDTPAIDAEAQVTNIVRMLEDKIPIIQDIKKEFNINATIVVVPHVYNGYSPVLRFNQQIINFCAATGTTISIDLYVYDKEFEDFWPIIKTPPLD